MDNGPHYGLIAFSYGLILLTLITLIAAFIWTWRQTKLHPERKIAFGLGLALAAVLIGVSLTSKNGVPLSLLDRVFGEIDSPSSWTPFLVGVVLGLGAPLVARMSAFGAAPIMLSATVSAGSLVGLYEYAFSRGEAGVIVLICLGIDLGLLLLVALFDRSHLSR